MSTPDLIVVGEVMVDVRAPAVQSGRRSHGSIRLRAGGTAVNAALAAASIGARVSVVGRVGNDGAGGSPATRWMLPASSTGLVQDAQSADGHLRRAGRHDRRGSRRKRDVGARGHPACRCARRPCCSPRTFRRSWPARSPELRTRAGWRARGERVHRPRLTGGRLRGRVHDVRGIRRRRHARTHDGVPCPSGSGRGSATGAGDAFAAGFLVELGRGRPLAACLRRGCSLGYAAAARGRTLTGLYHAGSGPLAQLVEQGTFNPKVVGSIPARPIHSDTNLTRRGRVDSAVVASYAESSVG